VGNHFSQDPPSLPPDGIRDIRPDRVRYVPLVAALSREGKAAEEFVQGGDDGGEGSVQTLAHRVELAWHEECASVSRSPRTFRTTAVLPDPKHPQRRTASLAPASTPPPPVAATAASTRRYVSQSVDASQLRPQSSTLETRSCGRPGEEEEATPSTPLPRRRSKGGRPKRNRLGRDAIRPS